MDGFKFTPLKLKGAYIIDCFYAKDQRGFLEKCYEKNLFHSAGISFQLSESFFSVSDENVIRGMHFQLHKPQAKLISVMTGTVWDVIADLRPDSVTYKEWESVELSEDDHRGLYIPKGFAHGFLSLKDKTRILYLCDGAYDSHSDSGIRYDDPDLGIIWPVEKGISKHSHRDLHLPWFREYERHPMEI